MLFNSFEYLLFLPIVFFLYWFVFTKLKWQNLLVVIASYVFYGWWNKTFLLLIAFTTLCSYASGLGIRYVKVNKCKSGGGDRWIATANILLNLGILGVYKYFNFFADSFSEVCKTLGWQVDPITLHLVLPVGISFYTFQALSYTIDVYKQKIEPTKDIVAFFAFISFFPQLVAGPIERATNLLPQFLKPRRFDYERAVDGTKQILWGLFKKMVIADNCADLVNQVWDDYTHFNSVSLVVAAVMFSFQIYGDFSGYSDIAIGTAKLFGVRLMRNFNVPYFSRDIAEFWRRWHISLNTWFVDYVYIPLGGSREGKWKSIRNTFIIFFLSGLWHGANWTYVCWGLFHACCFIPLLVMGKNRRFRDTVADGRLFPSIQEAGMILSTFLLVTLGWIIFRAGSMHEFWDYCQHIGSNLSVGETKLGLKTSAFIFLLLAVEWWNRTKEHPFQITIRHRAVRWSLYLVLALLCVTQAGQQVQFIYFQF
jgi:D-alanyl-lipoteichoic acid acyltransferase DltB (MBOAT superfamily)